MKKNKPSLCDVFDIMRELMYKVLKKSFLTRQSFRNLMHMNANSTSKGAHKFCPIHRTIIGESLSSVYNNHDKQKDFLQWYLIKINPLILVMFAKVNKLSKMLILIKLYFLLMSVNPIVKIKV